jgi:AcrR family transcriptional regulator
MTSAPRYGRMRRDEKELRVGTTKGTTAEKQEVAERDDRTKRRLRDSARTRRRLVAAAMRRFGSEGFAAARVRNIGNDAGVDPALINRYFESKEGLFEACLARASELLLQRGAHDLTELPDFMGARVADAVDHAGADEDTSRALALLLRSTGDEQAEAMRLGLLREFSQSLARMAGWSSERPEDGLLVRAEIAIAVGIGVFTLRSTGLEPIASADAREINEPLRRIMSALFDD